MLVLAELVFLQQELQFCDKDRTSALSSLNTAIQSLEDALLALEIVKDKAAYTKADKTYPHNRESRINDYPKDAFHQACLSHKTRIQNMLKVPGMNKDETALYKLRQANILVAHRAYFQLQKEVLGDKGDE
jgi:hypothetical protein